MAYSSLVVAPRDGILTKTSVTNVNPHAPAKRGVFSRLIDAMIAARQRQADREIARFLSTRGGRITDENEREIERRFLGRSFGRP